MTSGAGFTVGDEVRLQKKKLESVINGVKLSELKKSPLLEVVGYDKTGNVIIGLTGGTVVPLTVKEAVEGLEIFVPVPQPVGLAEKFKTFEGGATMSDGRQKLMGFRVGDYLKVRATALGRFMDIDKARDHVIRGFTRADDIIVGASGPHPLVRVYAPEDLNDLFEQVAPGTLNNPSGSPF